jgi:hypothetical protein
MPTGVDLDVQAGPLEVVAGLSLELGRLNDRYERDRLEERRQREAMRARVPMDVRFQASGICPTPTARFGLNIGGPDVGFYWLIRRLVVGGVTFKTVAAGSAEIYVTALAGQQGAASFGPIVAGLALSDMADQFASLPTPAGRGFYSNRQMVIQENENLVVLIDTGTAGQQYVAAAQVEVHRTVSDVETDYGA